MHAFVTSKNVKWCHLIWPTLNTFSVEYLSGLTFKPQNY